MGPSFIGALATASMNHGMTVPSLPIDCCGANLTLDALTDLCLVPLTLMLKERSRMSRKDLLLCSAVAIGDVLSFAGGSCLMSDHLTSRTCPAFSLALASAQQCLAACGFSADLWVPFVIAASIISVDQSSPQLAGQPLMAQSDKRGAAG